MGYSKKSKDEDEPSLQEEMGIASARYAKLDTGKASYLKRARDAAQLTIPS